MRADPASRFKVTRRTVLGAAAGLVAAAVAGNSIETANAQEGATHTVDMTDELVFDPDQLTIAPGDTVVWENVGNIGHTVTAYEDEIPEGATFFASGGFESEDEARSGYPEGDIPGGESYEHTFETTGTFEYFCVPHESAGMVGTIEVVEGGGGTGAEDGGEGGTEQPDFGGWLEGVDGGYRDARGQDAVTVRVGTEGNTGFFAFSPAGLWVDPGTTVSWEWMGQGGNHNVVADEGPAPLDSGDPVSDTGVLYEHTFEEGGLTTYVCEPHESLGMKGAVAVGDDVPTVSVGGGDGETGPLVPGGELGIAFVVLTLVLPGVAAVAVLFGEFFGSIRSRASGPSSAYTTGAVAAILGLLLILGITAQLMGFI